MTIISEPDSGASSTNSVSKDAGPKARKRLKAWASTWPLSFGVIISVSVIVVVFQALGVTKDLPSGQWPQGQAALNAEMFAVSPRYQLWVLVLSMTILLWIAVFAGGIILHTSTSWLHVGPRRWWPALVFDVSVGVLVVKVLVSLNPVSAEIPLSWWWLGRMALPILGLIAATPWIAMIWSVANLAAEASGAKEPETHKKSELPECVTYAGTGTRGQEGQPDKQRRKVRQEELECYWGIIEKCLFALALIISSATVSVLGLRFAVTAQRSSLEASFVDPSAFPTYAVTLYGGLFTLALAVVCLPLMFAWRGLKATIDSDELPRPADPNSPTQLARST